MGGVTDRIRIASTVIAARDTSTGPEILVVERSAASRFLPGYVAFPGGAVDDGDRALAVRWFGDGEEAARAGAVRELIEEVGLALTATGLVAADGAEPLAPVHATPPSPAQLPEIARWVAPDDVPVRFDARYFALRAGVGIDPVPDRTETADAWWVSPVHLLREWEAGERRLYWPTWLTVQEVSACGSVDELLELRFDPREPDDDELATMAPSVFWQDR
jgi:8-oxo-dGTP pyrophosphatase MutT (NUDIX family)